MWPLVTPSRKPTETRHAPARRSQCYRPDCKTLEDRRLLSVSLSGNGSSTALVGVPINWTVTSSGHGATPVYQFSAATTDGPSRVVRDFSHSERFTWNPLQEGSYQFSVTVKDSFSSTTGETATTTVNYAPRARASGVGAVISPTANRLVALYSVPASSGGSTYVQFKPVRSRQPWHSTASLPNVPGKSTNFLVAGMLPKRTYLLRHVLSDGSTSAAQRFTTGALPARLRFPQFSVEKGPNRRSDLSQNLVFHVGIAPSSRTVDTLATDRSGRIVWYFDPVANAFPGYAPNIVPGGTVLLLGGRLFDNGSASALREVDLAGNTLRETNVDAVNAQLATLGRSSIVDFNHEAQRLPNGGTAVLAASPRTIDRSGTPTQYEGDMVIVLDENFQVAWTWDPFAWLDTNRLPTQGEGPGDWLHANSIAWSPADGNLVVSLRSQDRVIKINYANGTGDGHVIWQLGLGGNFTLQATGAYPWFSHQHDARYIDDSTLILFDNGNTRRAILRRSNSRGQVIVLDEKSMTAKLVVNASLGDYASALGSAQRLPNGNLAFNSGFAQQTIELRPRGAANYVLRMRLPGIQYRSYIYQGLYGT